MLNRCGEQSDVYPVGLGSSNNCILPVIINTHLGVEVRDPPNTLLPRKPFHGSVLKFLMSSGFISKWGAKNRRAPMLSIEVPEPGPDDADLPRYRMFDQYRVSVGSPVKVLHKKLTPFVRTVFFSRSAKSPLRNTELVCLSLSHFALSHEH